ncbi:MAG TPA: lysylphosphatidylglycerol synthase transmembrane domain-containing protein [Vicinamibacterales bacterium]|nr:lysylphosphatidylglycerol synthase transmembrane domain-containing protein [Vicinamibacterales bacterium]
MQRRHLVFAAQAVGSLVLLAILFRSFDWQKSADALRHISASFYATSMGVVIVGQLMVTLRWQIMLKTLGIRVSFGEVFRQGLIGQFFSSLMPTAVGGDAAKVYYLGRRAGYTEVGASVFLDRFLGFQWLSILGAALAWSTPADSELLVLNRNALTLFAAILLTVSLTTLLPIERALAVIVPSRWGALRSRLIEFAGYVRTGVRSPSAIGVSLFVAVGFSWMMGELYRTYFRANGLPDLPILPVMLLILSMSIYANAPVSVNGIGLREQLHVFMFSGYGVPREVSVLISLLLFSHNLLLSLAGYVIWLKDKPPGPPS